jgi:hypothetical protein
MAARSSLETQVDASRAPSVRGQGPRRGSGRIVTPAPGRHGGDGVHLGGGEGGAGHGWDQGEETADACSTTRTRTRSTPRDAKPMRLAAASARSMMRRWPPPWGPRSLMVTTTCCPVRRFVTCTLVPSGRERCAAVNCDREKRAPLAVVRPSCGLPYQEAHPTWASRAASPCPTAGIAICHTAKSPKSAVQVCLVRIACPPGGNALTRWWL